jgi:hypothetical protein
MNELKEAALSLFIDGWNIENIREYLRSNYIDATCSSIEEAILQARNEFTV